MSSPGWAAERSQMAEYAIGEVQDLGSQAPWVVCQLVQGHWYPITQHTTMTEALNALAILETGKVTA